MQIMNQKGQAFSVFQLLIAAVVAGAILLILLQVLQVLPAIGSQNPNSVASNAVKSQINQPGLPQLLDNVTFKEGDSLNSRTIASESRVLSTENICLIVSESAPNAEAFERPSEAVITYAGSFSQQARLLVMCDRGDEMEASIAAYNYDDDPFNIDVGDCSNIGNNSNRNCIVAIVSDA